jgi:hypothetical protein
MHADYPLVPIRTPKLFRYAISRQDCLVEGIQPRNYIFYSQYAKSASVASREANISRRG